ncbi:MAG: RsiV family protein [Steroidobacteraceae bacterium]
MVGPKAATLNPPIQHWIGSDCDGDNSDHGLKDCLAGLASYCASPANGGNAPDSTCEDSITAAADMNSDGFLVIELTHSSHANMEPHANWVLEYLNVDVTNGRILDLSDLLTDHYEPTLDLLLVAALREQWNVPAGKTLTQFGMLTNDPGIPQQFAIRPHGLLLTYQVGDVGPDAFGNMQVLIPYTELSTLIRKNGPLARLIGRGPAHGSGGNAGASSPSKGSRQASISSS